MFLILTSLLNMAAMVMFQGKLSTPNASAFWCIVAIAYKLCRDLSKPKTLYFQSRKNEDHGTDLTAKIYDKLQNNASCNK